MDICLDYSCKYESLAYRGGEGAGKCGLLWKEGNVLFNDTLNTFHLRLYGVRHMVKDHSDSERGNPLPPHELLFLINSKGSFIYTIPDSTYQSLFYTSRGALAGRRNSSMGLPHEGLIQRTHRTVNERTYHGATSRSTMAIWFL